MQQVFRSHDLAPNSQSVALVQAATCVRMLPHHDCRKCLLNDMRAHTHTHAQRVASYNGVRFTVGTGIRQSAATSVSLT